MIKMTEILTLDKLVYSTDVPKKHREIMANISNTIFADFDIRQFKSTPPPKNSSNQTFREMISLDKIMMPLNQINAADHVDNYFKGYFIQNNLDFPTKDVRKIVQDSKPIILTLKYFYNRPRPAQVAKALSLKFHHEPLETAKTPSYPSGHSTQAFLVGKYLSAIYPEHSVNIMNLADDISKSRLAANIHYPTDSIFGERIALALYLYMRNKL